MSVEVSKLKNGLTVVTESMPHLESAAMGVWVKSGSRNETKNQHGISHLLEHMAFKGTKNRTARQIAEEIESVGGDLNAATSVETTAYYARVMGENVPLATDILYDILANTSIDAEELEREKHVILQEIGAAQDTPDDLVFDNFQDTAFGGQSIGRPIMGTPDTVTSFSASDIRQYLNEHYHGPNMVLAAAGSVGHAELLKQAEDTFSSFEAEVPGDPSEAKYVGGENRLKHDYQEAQVILGFEGKAYHARDFYCSQLMSGVLGGGMSSRLFQEVREKRGLCYSVYAFHWGFSDTGVFGVHAATGEEDLAELMPVILDELKRLSDNIGQEELDRARAQIRASLMMSMESPASRAGHLARQILLFGRPIPNDELMERINAITVERMRDLAGRTFQDTKPTLTAVGPIKTLMSLEEMNGRLSAGYSDAAE